jgi:hypothetical protein
MSADGGDPLSKAVTREDAASALPALRIAARWALLPALWSEVDRTVTAMFSAVAANDGEALQSGVRDLTLLGPVRRAAQDVAVPAPAHVLDDLTELIDVLAALTELGGSQPAGDDARGLPGAVSLPITIYLRDEFGHELVERAVEGLITAAGFTITERGDPVLGSWFRRMRATLGGAARSPEGRAVLEATALRADLELVQRPDAEVAALWMANIAPLLATLQNQGDAVIYLGVVLIVKSDGKTFAYKLTTHQQLVLNNSPHLLTTPESILRTLGAPAGDALPLVGEISP